MGWAGVGADERMAPGTGSSRKGSRPPGATAPEWLGVAHRWRLHGHEQESAGAYLQGVADTSAPRTLYG